MALALGCQAGVAFADVRLDVDRLSGEGWEIRGLQVDGVESIDRIEYALVAAQLQVMGRTFESVAWTCILPLPLPSMDATPADKPDCAGPLQAGRRTIGAISWSPETPREIDWRDRKAHVKARGDEAGWQVEFSGVPIGAWLAALQPPEVPISWRGGNLRGNLAWRAENASLQVDLNVQGLAFDGLDGRAAAEELGASIHAELSPNADEGWSLASRTTLRAGLWLLGPALLQPPAGTDLHVDLQAGTEGVRQGRLRTDDHDAASIDMAFHRNAGQAIEASTWQLVAEFGDLGTAWPRYLQGVVDWAGMPGLSAAGRVHARAAGRGDRIDRIDLSARDLSVLGTSGALRAEPGSLDVHWARVGGAEPSHWQFPGGRWRGAEFGPVDLAWSSTDGRIALSRTATTALFGGRLEIPSLSWSPFDGSLSMSARIADMALAPLTTWLGWPKLEGRLSGNLPAAHYRDETLSFDGGLSAGLLGGEARVDALRWERPFGVAPSLSADVRFQDLDLEPLTSTFGFGAITGRLDGEILGLRLLDGSPVQFEASLRTDPAWKGKQRISQRAVNDLSSIGGGGAAAGLQASVLKVFEEFSYKQIAISCRLERGVCHMGGIDSRSGGYTLVEGSGLPRITVNGFQKQVDWSVLVARLKAATSDGGVRVE